MLFETFPCSRDRDHPRQVVAHFKIKRKDDDDQKNAEFRCSGPLPHQKVHIMSSSKNVYDDKRVNVSTAAEGNRNFYIGPFYFHQLNLSDEQMDPWD